MELDQLSKTVQWLDDERRKDKQEIAALQERLSAAMADSTALQRRMQQLESDWTASAAVLQRLSRLDSILDGYRQEMTKQLGEVEQRRAEAEREGERLRKVEREGLNKSLLDLRKSVESVSKLERDALARKEEETRIARVVAEAQKKVADFSRFLDERGRALAMLEEGRRQDAKRITDLQTELADLRKRSDDNRGKQDMLEDVVRRTETRVGDLAASESERRAAQAQWSEAQALAQAERDRAWAELREKIEAAFKAVDDNVRRVEQYAEVNRTVKQSADDLRQASEMLERRITEVAEMQRLAEERFRQEWTAFLADDQKRWTTHMLLRDEQWREHDRLTAKQLERLETLEEQTTQAADVLQHLRVVDAARLQTLEKVIREMLAEYDQDLTHVR